MKKRMGVLCFLASSLYCWTPPHFELVNVAKSNDNNIAYIYAHGLNSTKRQAYKLFKPYDSSSIFFGPLGLFDFPDAVKAKKVNSRYVNLGQEKDICRLEYACKQTMDQCADCNGLVLVGVSRGAATILNYAATRKPEHIKAIVLEATYDTLKNIVKHLLRRFKMHWFPFSKKLGMKIANRRFKDLKVDGIFPVDVVAKIDKSIPILLVHSHQDRVVPLKSSHILYVTLRLAGHHNVHLLELEEGSHAKAMLGPLHQKYTSVVHAFYQKYDLPHNSTCAQRGVPLFAQCQPSVKDVSKRKTRRSPNATLLE